MPTISVIVPVYKVEAYLCRCIDSILAQTCKDFELILVDDGSPDNCGAICDEYAAQDSRVIVIHQENGGLSAARNAGIDWMMANSDSQWISFVDSDDYIHPKMLEVLLDAVLSTDTKISICGFQRTNGEDLVVDDIPTPQLWKPEDYYVQHNVNATVAWGKLYHRECFQEIRYPVGKLHEDEFVTYRILFRYTALSVIMSPLYGYYQNANGIMHSNTTRIKRGPDRFDSLMEQYLFFRYSTKIDPGFFARNCYLSLCDSLNMSHSHKHIYCEFQKRAKSSYPILSYHLNRYDRIYLYLLRFPFVSKWIVDNDYEPIQSIIRKILWWKYRK